MRHLDEGRLWALLDGEGAERERQASERHLARCGACRSRLDAARLGVQGLRAKLAAVEPRPLEPDARTAWRQTWQVWGPRAHVRAPQASARPSQGLRPLALGLAAVAALGIAVTVRPVRAGAEELLSLFQAQRLEVVNIDSADASQLAQALASDTSGVNLRGLGQMGTRPSSPAVQVPVPAADTALPAMRQFVQGHVQSVVSFPVELPQALPAGYRLEGVTVTPSTLVWIRPDVAGLNALLAKLGSTQRLPQDLNGVRLVLRVPSGVILKFLSQGGGAPLWIGQGLSPTLEVPPEVDVQSLRTTLLDLPFLPSSVRSELEAVSAWQHTLVLPGVAGVSSPVQVGNAAGAFIREPSGSSVVVWLGGGVVRAVRGSLGQAQELALASGMR